VATTPTYYSVQGTRSLGPLDVPRCGRAKDGIYGCFCQHATKYCWATLPLYGVRYFPLYSPTFRPFTATMCNLRALFFAFGPHYGASRAETRAPRPLTPPKERMGQATSEQNTESFDEEFEAQIDCFFSLSSIGDYDKGRQ
jgi:hypothetical protein